MTKRGKILESVEVIRSMHNGFGGLDDSIPQDTGNGGLQPFAQKPFNSIDDSQAADGYFVSQSGCEDIGFKGQIQAHGFSGRCEWAILRYPSVRDVGAPPKLGSVSRQVSPSR